MASQNLVLFIIGPFSLALLSLFSNVEGFLASDDNFLREFSQSSSSSSEGTKWAVLVAGSNGYWNYRHQADICHAYHILKKGGLKDENIIVFMYDDIAYNKENPRPGVIINNPKGQNFYPGVPKDYTGKAVNSENFYAVILGNKTATKGGSGKVLKTGPNDHIFIYYADHGAAGLLGMPNDEDVVYAKDLIKVLIKKHASKSYKKMVIYVEACESGSVFDGLLPKNLSIYVTTAANPNESSFATYCGDDVPVPKGYEGTCLGDVYSVSWMEDSDDCNPMKETLKQQYIAVKRRTATSKGESSHVMQYGELSLSEDLLGVYFVGNSSKLEGSLTYTTAEPEPPQTYNTAEPDPPGSYTTSEDDLPPLFAVEQRDADLVYFKHKVRKAPEGTNEQTNALKELNEVISHRKHVDESVEAIGKALFGEEKGLSLLHYVRPAGQVLVDDWDCLKAMVKTYEAQCGPLKTYGKKYSRAFANICNAGVHTDQMAQASTQVCKSKKAQASTQTCKSKKDQASTQVCKSKKQLK